MSGCGYYRMLFPKMAIQTGSMSKEICFVESTKFIVDQSFFQNIRMVRLQRQVTSEQAAYFTRFLKPVADAFGFWLVYEIDDVVLHDDMPDYNQSKKSYPVEFGQNINKMLNDADFVTVTTQELANYYSTKCNIPLDKFVVVPNYIPKWWAGQFSIEQKKANFDSMRKPKLLFSGASSHVDLSGTVGYDDYTHLIEFIKGTTNKYDWTFIGLLPTELYGEAKAGKIKVERGFDFLNYLQGVSSINPHAIIAPLDNNVFNSCKSNIKQLEGWATGIPVLAQDCLAYNKWCSPDNLFKGGNDIQNRLDKLLKSRKTYIEAIRSNLNEMNVGGPNHTGWWLENNMQMWNTLSSMPQKTLKYDLRKVKDA